MKNCLACNYNYWKLKMALCIWEIIALNNIQEINNNWQNRNNTGKIE